MEPVVKLGSNCSVKGTLIEAAASGGVPVARFLGIPYAQPPVGSLRFRPTAPCELWEGELTAQKYGPFCPQNVESARAVYFPFHLEDNMSEDCLNLNIWTPASQLGPTGAKLAPVMIWIYGGGFIQGCCNYFDGSLYAAQHGIVYISFNYRVGAFGFMSLGNERIRGNMGLFDQIELLRWVQKYVSKFGGDPANVTLFGESGGAICISALLTSRLVQGQGLFHKVIQQSGSCVYFSSNWLPGVPREYNLSCLREIGLINDDEATEFVLGCGSSQLVSAYKNALWLVVDGVCITDIPSKLYRRREFDAVPLLIGFNSSEGAQFVYKLIQEKPNMTLQDVEEYLYNAVFNRKCVRKREIYDTLHKAYFSNVTESVKFHKAIADIFGDHLFASSSVENAHIHSEKAATYMYQFDYRPNYSAYPDWVTADHWQEIPFVFGEPLRERLSYSWLECERKLSSGIMKFWANFARTGPSNLQYKEIATVCTLCSNPNGELLPLWPEFSEGSYMHMTTGLQARTALTALSADKISLWTEVNRLANDNGTN